MRPCTFSLQRISPTPNIVRSCNHTTRRIQAFNSSYVTTHSNVRQLTTMSAANLDSTSTEQRSAEHHSCLWTNITRTYERALTGGACAMTNTRCERMRDALPNGQQADFILRIASALKDKPSGNDAAKKREKGSWRNPFLPYEDELWVQHLSDTHTLLLNKFNLVAYHVLVVTRQFEAQEDPLNIRDLEALLQVLQAMRPAGLAYYNCGPLSGASQPHKHVQVVPLPLADEEPVEPPLGSLLQQELLNIHGTADQRMAGPPSAAALRSWPFEAYACRLPQRLTAAAMQQAYASLLAAPPSPLFPAQSSPGPAGLAVDRAAALQTAGGITTGAPPAADAATPCPVVSHNLLVTTDWMLLVPRGAAGAGPVSLNAVGFAGSLFVRSQAEIEHLKASGPWSVLAAVGRPWQSS